MTEQMFEHARRTFDTPEFRGITCTEVEARSVININKVPGGMPFDRTINPYAGARTPASIASRGRPIPIWIWMPDATSKRRSW